MLVVSVYTSQSSSILYCSFRNDPVGPALTIPSPYTPTQPQTDETIPYLTSVLIASDFKDPRKAGVGSRLTLTFIASEALNTSLSAVSMAGASNIPITLVDSGTKTYKADLNLASSNTAGLVAFSISFYDNSGNAGTAVTSVSSGDGVSIGEDHFVSIWYRSQRNLPLL